MRESPSEAGCASRNNRPLADHPNRNDVHFPTPDGNCIVSYVQLRWPASDKDGVAVGRISTLEEIIAIVQHDVGHTPGMRVRPTDEQHRNSRQRCPDDVIAWRGEMNLIPSRWQAKHEVRIVCQYGVRFAIADGSDGPTIAPAAERVESNLRACVRILLTCTFEQLTERAVSPKPWPVCSGNLGLL